MTMVFDRSEKKVIAGPIEVYDDEPVTKYRAGDGRTFWAYNSMEVFYPDERMYAALDRIAELELEVTFLKGQIISEVLDSFGEDR